MKLSRVCSILLMTILLTGCAVSKDVDSQGRTGQKRILTREEKTRLVTATIYYTPDYSSVDLNQCSDKKNLNVINQKNIGTVYSYCKDVVDSCRLQGSCIVRLNNSSELINYYKKINGEASFKIVNTSICPYGLGDSTDLINRFKTMCLDPYRSVAADLSIYRLGDVIYMPDLVGISLPNGELHDGYLIVRDSGGKIKGIGRFDFFTGFQGTSKTTNPFARVGLGGGVFLNYIHYSFDHPISLRIRQQNHFPFTY